MQDFHFRASKNAKKAMLLKQNKQKKQKNSTAEPVPCSV